MAGLGSRRRGRATRHRGRVFPIATAAVALVFVCSSTAHAYLDPGTGSALLYVVSGLVLSIYFAARGLYYKLRDRVFSVGVTAQKCELAIHSEDRRYETTFVPVLKALAERNVRASYFTMYERDASCEPLPDAIAHQVIPDGLVGYSFLNRLEAKLLVTTTPQLDVMMFRRSKRVQHYCMIQHALGESRFVRPFAYDFFDTVMCCGPLLQENIRSIEQKRQLPAKQLLETGVPHYDILLERARALEQAEPRDVRDGGKPTVLVAPSWGPMSLFSQFGSAFVAGLATRFNVVVRPHPQMKISQKELYEEVLAITGVRVDTAPSPTTAMAEADIVVSDISGIAYEFAFLYQRPVVVVDHKLGVEGLEGHLLGDVQTLRELCKEFVIAVSPSEMSDLADHVSNVLGRQMPERIAKARDEVVHHFGHAGGVAAQQLHEILARL
jgi:hypothetical protein